LADTLSFARDQNTSCFLFTGLTVEPCYVRFHAPPGLVSFAAPSVSWHLYDTEVPFHCSVWAFVLAFAVASAFTADVAAAAVAPAAAAASACPVLHWLFFLHAGH